MELSGIYMSHYFWRGRGGEDIGGNESWFCPEDRVGVRVRVRVDDVGGDRGWFCPKVRVRIRVVDDVRGDRGWFCPKVRVRIRREEWVWRWG